MEVKPDSIRKSTLKLNLLYKVYDIFKKYDTLDKNKSNIKQFLFIEILTTKYN